MNNCWYGYGQFRIQNIGSVGIVKNSDVFSPASMFILRCSMESILFFPEYINVWFQYKFSNLKKTLR